MLWDLWLGVSDRMCDSETPALVWDKRTGLDVADLSSAGPDVPHVVTDGLGSRHGAGELACLNDRCSTLLNRLREMVGKKERKRKSTWDKSVWSTGTGQGRTLPSLLLSNNNNNFFGRKVLYTKHFVHLPRRMVAGSEQSIHCSIAPSI